MLGATPLIAPCEIAITITRLGWPCDYLNISINRWV